MALTEAQLEQIREQTRRERAEQGLPPTVEDPVVLAKIARLCAGVAANAPAGGRGPSPVVGGKGTNAEAAS